MDAIELLRSQYKGAHDLLEVTMADVTLEQAHWAPPGIANPLGATYAHVLMGEDFLLNVRARGTQALSMSSHSSNVGVSEPPPPAGPANGEWARRVKVDLPQLREYAQAVYKETDSWLATLTPDDLDNPIDMSAFGMGEQPMATLVAGIVPQHINNHLGEIACLKGMQGAKGYPF